MRRMNLFGGGKLLALYQDSLCLRDDLIRWSHKNLRNLNDFHQCQKFDYINRFIFFGDTKCFSPLKVIRYHAFTLAEVLITLGIIGVVAALTLPVLTANK